MSSWVVDAGKGRIGGTNPFDRPVMVTIKRWRGPMIAFIGVGPWQPFSYYPLDPIIGPYTISVKKLPRRAPKNS